MEEILKNAKSMPNSRLYLQAEAVQTVETGYGPLPPAIMDQLAAAAAAQYVGQPVGVPPPHPGPQATPLPQGHGPPPPPSQPPAHLPRSTVVDAAVQTDVTTVVQSKQEIARAQLAAANRLLASTSSSSHPYNSCQYCGRGFSKKEYLRRHVRIHTGERPYRCVVCQLSFRRSHHLRRHELMHTDIRPFSCHACDKAFKQKQHLERHLASHTDLRAYPCSLCDKAFKQKQHLDRHLHCHSGEKPFACHLCEKAFTRKQHLDRHIKMHTGELERTYKCHVCEKMFFRSHHRDKHLKSHGIAALETKNRPMNFQMMNMDMNKAGQVDAMNTTVPHSASSDSGSDTDDGQKPPVSDKPNSQVTKMVEGCRKRKTHSPVRLALGDKKNRIGGKSNAASNTGTNTPNTSEANGQQTPNMANQRSTFDYSGMRNDIVFPRNEAVSALAVREGGNNGTLGQSTSTDGSGMQTPHMGNGNQGLETLQHAGGQQQQHQQQFMGMNMGITSAQLQQLQQQMSATGGKMDSGTQHQDNGGPAKTPQPQPLIVPSSHFTSASKMGEVQPKYSTAAAAIAGRQLQQTGVGVGVMEQPMHFKPVVGTQGAGGPHQAWSHALNWPPRLSLMPDGSLQGMPTLTTYGTVNMADLNQVSGAAMYTAQKAMEMRMAAGLHRSPSIGTDTWVPVSGSDRDAQRGAPSANDRRIYSPQPNT